MVYSLPRLPRFSYNVTRDFQGRWFAPLVIIGIIAVLGILIPLNFALTGYETVSVVQSNFSEVPDLWFWRFGNKPPPGSLCEPRTLNIGDTFTTNYTVFTWTVESIFDRPPLGLPVNDNSLANLPTVRYSGTNLDNCDVVNMRVEGSLQVASITFKAFVVCNDTDFPAMMSTAFTLLPVNTDREYVLDTFAPQSDAGLGPLVSILFQSTGTDIKDKTTLPDSGGLIAMSVGLFMGMARLTNVDGPLVFCHNPRLGPIDESCTAVPVAFRDFDLIYSYANGTTPVYWPSHLPDTYAALVANTMQLILAAVRLDTGNVFSNNFLVYPDLLNATITSHTSLYNQCVYNLQTDKSILKGLGDASRPATISSQYLCHFPQRKPLAQAFISVLVATLSMFSSAWAGFLLIAAYYERKTYAQGNDRHEEYQTVPRDDMQEVVDGPPLLGRNRDEL
ncbi:hypothetical protein FRB94_011390 [Tulasnella sp. JGI-2019a]|nr:hypothetical protein FRB94_011390 [Tulasnella sp. JGI-2019a]